MKCRQCGANDHDRIDSACDLDARIDARIAKYVNAWRQRQESLSRKFMEFVECRRTREAMTATEIEAWVKSWTE